MKKSWTKPRVQSKSSLAAVTRNDVMKVPLSQKVVHSAGM